MHCLDSSKDGLLVLRHITSQKLKPTVELVCFFSRFPGEKLHCLDSSKEGLLVLRHITSQKLKPIYYRENRPHLLAENIKFELENDTVGYITVTHPCNILQFLSCTNDNFQTQNCDTHLFCLRT